MRDSSGFTSAWPGGYFEGDPRDPFGLSSYFHLGYVSSLYATYLVCLKPHVTSETNVLEIGPGRGAWTKAILALGPKMVWALDAASDEHTGFSAYVGSSSHVQYHQVKDESLREVPDRKIDLFFSFGVFCHLPEQVVGSYLVSLYDKMAPGAHGYFLVADFEQRSAAARNASALDRLFSLRRFSAHRFTHRVVTKVFRNKFDQSLRHTAGVEPRWYDIGKVRAGELAQFAGFEVSEIDVGTCPRDPILHIIKPG